LTITRSIAQAIDRDVFLVLQDGALLMRYPAGAVLAWHNLKQSVAQSACDILLNAGLSALVFAPLPDGQHFDVLPSGGNTLSPGLRAYLRSKSGQFCRRNEGYRLFAASSKIVTIDSQGKTDAAYYRLKRHLPQARVIRTEARGLDAWFMEVGSPLASKMQGLQTLLQHLRLSFAEVIAVGDAENDVEILRAAGLGVAMDNASERVKAVANLVIKSNSEDGLARFLKDEELVLSLPKR
jgi:hydroxymethylpyrimidine pyrophosphatase-like HAD family hydrolase